MRILHGPRDFISLGSGLPGGGGFALAPVLGFTQCRLKTPLDIQWSRDRSREAVKTALAAMLWYSSLDIPRACGSDSVGSGLFSQTFAGNLTTFFSAIGAGDAAAGERVFGLSCSGVVAADSFCFFAAGVAVDLGRPGPRFSPVRGSCGCAI
jgi:hypothetical protein